jgi:phosphohistidine phosphatase
MRELHLLRHAKSAWDRPGLPDRERPLNKRGRRDAPRMGAALSSLLAPTAIAVSPAQRARLTLEGLCVGWPALADCRHVVEEDLYTFSSDDLLDWLVSRDDSQHSLFLIGHNPALTDLVNTLADGAYLENLPTAGYARLSLDIPSWAGITPCCSRLVQTLFPRELPED